MPADTFIPGEYWTPERAAEAARRMLETLASAEMQAAMQMAGASDDPAAAAAALVEAEPPSSSPRPVAKERCRVRRGKRGDEPRLAQLIAEAHLPPLFIEEFLPGFAVVEHEGEIVGCGGLELYDDCGVIRSVVTGESARGLGFGRRISDLLIEDARAFGATDLYLFTMDAWEFWKHLGFVDIPLEEWKMPPRASWQYQFNEMNSQFAAIIHGMWRKA